MNLGNLPVEATLAVLLIMSMITWFIGISKYLYSRRMTREARSFLQSFWQCKDLNSAEQIAKTSQCDFALLASAGFGAYNEYQRNPSSLGFYGDVNEVM
jgi:biopolymer transport protein ExbB/TolQ